MNTETYKEEAVANIGEDNIKYVANGPDDIDPEEYAPGRVVVGEWDGEPITRRVTANEKIVEEIW